MYKRTVMEASENAGLPPEGGGGTGLQPIDSGHIAETLRSANNAAGFSRLELMLNTILPRLAGDAPDPRRG
jgi:hypothetical protein